jgi:peptidoglycan/LPS O-acetylase OafA/YrhL
MLYCQSAHVLRGLAALAVAWFDFTNGQPLFLEKDSLLRLSGTYGYLGVVVFFAISGFVIPYSLDRMGFQFPQDIFKFIKRRFWRIYPTYVVAATITVALLYASYVVPFSHSAAPTLDARTIIGHLTYTVPWFGAEWYSPIYWFRYENNISLSLSRPGVSAGNNASRLCLWSPACPLYQTIESRFWYCPRSVSGLAGFFYTLSDYPQ